MADNNQRESGGTEGGKEPPAEQHNIAFAIQSLARQYEAAQHARAEQDKKSFFLDQTRWIRHHSVHDNYLRNHDCRRLSSLHCQGH